MPFLSAEGISVRFGGVRALAEVFVELEPGRISGLVGPNGAGKTTLFNVLSGLQRPSAGRVVFDGRDISGLSPYARARRGIARTFQRVETFSSLTVRDNVLVAAEVNPRFRRSAAKRRALVSGLIERTGLTEVADHVVGSLPTGTSRLVELARSLAASPRLLLLDEPSSGLDAAETASLGAVITEMVADGMAVLLVEHDVPFVMSLSEDVYVLDFGVVLAHGAPGEIQADPRVQAAYLGTKAAS